MSNINKYLPLNNIDFSNLTDSQLIDLCKIRLSNDNKKVDEIKIEDKTFKYFNGVSFIIIDYDYEDELFSFHFNKFYPNEFLYLVDLGII